MESASADDVRARGSPKGLVLAPLQAQAQHYPKGEGWKRSQFGSRKRSQTDRQTDAPTNKKKARALDLSNVDPDR